MAQLPRCPMCGTTFSSTVARPFCSDRCRQTDLGRWFDGSYRIETNERDPRASGGAFDASEAVVDADPPPRESECD